MLSSTTSNKHLRPLRDVSEISSHPSSDRANFSEIQEANSRRLLLQAVAVAAALSLLEVAAHVAPDEVEGLQLRPHWAKAVAPLELERLEM
jgi:hypothetical protein